MIDESDTIKVWVFMMVLLQGLSCFGVYCQVGSIIEKSDISSLGIALLYANQFIAIAAYLISIPLLFSLRKIGRQLAFISICSALVIHWVYTETAGKFSSPLYYFHYRGELGGFLFPFIQLGFYNLPIIKGLFD